MFCSSCGNELAENQNFCTKCGARAVQVNRHHSEPSAVEMYTGNSSVEETGGLIRSLQKALPIYMKIDEYYSREAAIYRSKISGGGLVGLGFVGLVLSITLTQLLGAFLPISIYDLGFLLGVLGTFGFPIIVSVTNKKRIKRDIQKNREEANEYIYANGCQEMFVVPEDYRYYIAIEYILRCLTDGRADSLKEALNLFVEQRDRWYQLQMTQQIVAVQRQQSAYLKFIAASSFLNLMR